jgi:hypothetical protein
MTVLPSSAEPAGSRKLLFAAILLLAFSLFVLPGPAMAQSTFGSIVGTVKDPSGGMIPGATVTLTDIGTSATRTVRTDPQGSYAFVNVSV